MSSTNSYKNIDGGELFNVHLLLFRRNNKIEEEVEGFEFEKKDLNLNCVLNFELEARRL